MTHHPQVIAFLESLKAEILSDDEDMTEFNHWLLPTALGYGRIEYPPAPKRASVRLAVAKVTLSQYNTAKSLPFGFGFSVAIDMGQTPHILVLDHMPQILPDSCSAAAEVLRIIFDQAEYEIRGLLDKIFGSTQVSIAGMTRQDRADQERAPHGYRLN